MRGLTKKDKIEGYDKLKRERNALEEFAWHTVNGDDPDARETFEEICTGFRDAGMGEIAASYSFALYGAQRAAGGILVHVFRSPCQRGHVEVYYFEDWIRNVEALPFGVGLNTEIKIASERLQAARLRLYREAGAS